MELFFNMHIENCKQDFGPKQFRNIPDESTRPGSKILS